MSRKHWVIFAVAIAFFGLFGAAIVLALIFGFFAERAVASVAGTELPVYTSDQSASSHPGYRHSTLTRGSEVYVNDYEEAGLQLANPEPNTFIGRMGNIGNAKVAAIPGQPTTSYVAGDCGSEMPAYTPYRNIKQPPFDWRRARFRELSVSRPGGGDPLTTTNAAVIAEVVRVLNEGKPVGLPSFPFAGTPGVTTMKFKCDELPALVFCPSIYFHPSGKVYLAESLMLDPTAQPTQLTARWIPAGPVLTEWLKSR